LNFGGIGGFLVIKLVKPTKALCSWTPHQTGVNQFLLPQTESDIRTGSARILRETDSAMRQKFRGLDSADCVFDKMAELLALVLSDRGSQILDLDQPFTDENDLSDF
jgi:hypothetical protein